MLTLDTRAAPVPCLSCALYWRDVVRLRAPESMCCSPQLGDLVGSCQANPTLRSIVVQITDQCPECEPDHLDIQALTWAKVSSFQPAGVHVLASCTGVSSDQP